ncbi:hypothetical protein Syun_008167 [Stephania yunnanensis]|uniref:Uncharacterized protein n=1 Tax=Stephania yunnanensis TaxID=152371 RepID=A0AAP0KZY1_9MAGN
MVFISERSGSARIYSQSPRDLKPRQIPTVTNALFHDRPSLINNNRLYFTSLHEPSGVVFKSSCAVYCTNLEDGKTVRLTPRGAVDYSPAVSRSGKLVAVASYGFKPWEMEFNEMRTDIVVFPASILAIASRSAPADGLPGQAIPPSTSTASPTTDGGASSE